MGAGVQEAYTRPRPEGREMTDLMAFIANAVTVVTGGALAYAWYRSRPRK